MNYNKDFIKSLGFEPPYILSVGFYWYDESHNRLEYWNDGCQGSLHPPTNSELNVGEVVQRLNNETIDLYILPSDYIQEGENKAQAVERLQKERGISLREAKDLIEGNRPEYIYVLDTKERLVLPNGYLATSVCLIPSTGKVLPIIASDVLKLKSSESIIISDEDIWELLINYEYPFTTKIRLASFNISSGDWTLYYDGSLPLKLGRKSSKEPAFTGTKEQCIEVQTLIEESYKEGKELMNRRIKEIIEN
jgi:hypothetical protein